MLRKENEGVVKDSFGLMDVPDESNPTQQELQVERCQANAETVVETEPSVVVHMSHRCTTPRAVHICLLISEANDL